MPPDLQSQLERFLAGRLSDADGVRVLGLERNMEGFSQECFSFDAEVRRGQRCELRSYVSKREPLTGLLEPYDLEPEFKVLHALSGQALLSPPTPSFSDDPALLERPFYVMETLRNRIEEKAELFEAESASAEQALAQLVSALHDAAAGTDAAALERACADAPPGPPGERALALRAALLQAVDALYALPSRDALPEAARAALGAHLGPQAVRDVLPLTRSKLNEISKG
jgi:aminoglycoside phosphotransferase (APT) family kinase protein